jgi:hypothetical protein
MKKFSELTNSQKEEAVKYAYSELRELMDLGFVHFGKEPKESDIRDYAIMAAFEALYSESGDNIVAGIVE